MVLGVIKHACVCLHGVICQLCLLPLHYQIRRLVRVFVRRAPPHNRVWTVFVRGVKLKPPSLTDGHTEDGLTQEQWAPLTRNDAPKTCGLRSPWQPPMGQGEHG